MGWRGLARCLGKILGWISEHRKDLERQRTEMRVRTGCVLGDSEMQR